MFSSKSRRAVRPYVRKAEISGLRKQKSAGTAARLARAAGAGWGAGRADVDVLEPRKLLFTLTIQPGDVGPDGLGEARAWFAYAIPYLAKLVPETQQGEVVIEEFDDEDGPWTEQVPAIPPNGTILSASQIQLSYSTPGSNVFLIDGPDLREGGDNDRDLHVELFGNGFVSFAFLQGADQGQGIPRVTAQASFVIRRLNTSGIDGTKVQLLRGGQVVQTLQGAALAALATPVIGLPGENNLRYDFNFADGFDAVRFSSVQLPPDNETYFDEFDIDDIRIQFPETTFGEFINERIFGAEVVFTGPVGSSVTFLDLYGRPMLATLRVGIPPGGELPIGAPTGRVFLDFNEGIGQIIMSGTDLRSTLTLYGGTVTATTTPSPEDRFFEGGFAFRLPQNAIGIFDDLEQAGFGYGLPRDPQPTVIGLPAGTGSVIVGSPFVRPLGNYLGPIIGIGGEPVSVFPGITGPGSWLTNDSLYRLPEQGIRVTGGASIGSVLIHGVVHGSSRFTGAVDRLAIGLLLGSVSIDGDAKQVIIASDAGHWQPDDTPEPADAARNPDEIIRTRSELVVGRTLGELLIGGRNMMDVTVLADINNPARARVDFLNYVEREVAYFLANPPQATQRATIIETLDWTDFGLLSWRDHLFGQAVPFGPGYFRNDSILSAEFVGGNTTAINIQGAVGRLDPVNTARDAVDVYAFAAGPDSLVVVDVAFNLDTFGFGASLDFDVRAWARIVDADGRTVAAHEYPTFSNQEMIPYPSVRMTFRPDHADVFYLVLNTPVDPPFTDFELGYFVAITGMLPTTFGGYRTGATSGYTPFIRPNDVAVNVQAGSMGLVRVGTGFVGGDAQEKSPGEELINTVDDDDDLMSLRNTVFNVARNLYGVMLGSDTFNVRGDGSPGPQFQIGGNLGTFRTGMSAVVGTGPEHGDVEDLHLQVGGTIGVIDIRGAVRLDQDNGIFVANSQAVNIRSGAAGGPGHIGVISVGQSIWAQNFTIRTSPGSIIDAFLVGQGFSGDEGDGVINQVPPFFNLGAGSVVRFASFNSIDSRNDPNALRPLVQGVPVTLTDNSGAVITIEIRGGSALSAGSVRFLPINGSQGVAIGRIDANLLGGSSLIINGVSGGRASIGSIVVTTDDGGLRPSIQIGGNGEIDVWQIRQTDGGIITQIQNSTVNGDIIAADVQSLGELIIRTGHLGRTETNGVGPRLLGTFRGIASGYVTDAGGALGLNPASMNPNWNGQTYPPINVRTSSPADDVTLADIGAPFQPWLNGLIVRTGGVARVNVGGAVGDVILQGGALDNLIANARGTVDPHTFRGIVGSIYAGNINFIDVGDGIAAYGPGPLARAGIFSDNDITRVLGGRNLSPVISGLIVAANITTEAGVDNGIGRVELHGGRYDGAFIGAATFDSFWRSARFEFTIPNTDVPIATGDVNSVRGTNADLFRSWIMGININEVALTGGAFDASLIDATANVNQVSADEFRNSTRLGESLEYHRNEIIATRNLGRVFTNGFAGDISDLRVDIQGSLTNNITARNLIRVELDVDGTVHNVVAQNDIRASSIRAGTLNNVNALANIRSSSFNVAGAIDRITAGQNITTVEINSTGPDGRINRIQAAGFITGKIQAEGQILNIISTGSDIIADITTVGPHGHLHTLQAAGDVRSRLDISGHVDRIVAGRNIGALGEEGSGRAISVRGNLNILQAQGGQIYTDVRVGEGIGLIQQARVAALPGHDLTSRATIHAFGRIARVDIAGDLNGSIISESGGIGIVNITDGSFRPGNVIRANAGGIDEVIITGGHLMGSIIAGEHIGAVRVLPSAAGFWGDIGINPNLSQFVFFDGLRNQMPPGVAPTTGFDGPRIQAGTNIGLVEVARGSMWESQIYAGHSLTRLFVAGVILNDHITPGLGGSWVVVGDTLGEVDVGHFVGGAYFLAGITDLGADNLPGGVGANADTVQFGRINTLIFRGGTGMITVAAGINAGPDGFYTINPGPDGIRGTADDILDDEVADGFSSIGSIIVHGPAIQSTAFAANHIGATPAEMMRGGWGLKQKNPGRVLEVVTAPPGVEITPGAPFAFSTAAGETGRITFTGPGRAYWDQETQTLALVNTTLASSVIVDSDQNSLTDVRIASNHAASMGFASIRANLKGNSSFYFDAYVQHAEFGFLDTTGVIGAGNDIGTLVVGPTSRAHIRANYINHVHIAGNFGTPDTVQQAFIQLLAGGLIEVMGNMSGRAIFDRDVNQLTVAGTIDRGLIRSGRSLSNITAGAMNFARISSRNDINNVTINGNVIDSVIYAGGDLGTNGTFGGTGLDADVVTPGSINRVVIRGNFIRSDIAAGIHRGADGFLGTADDVRSEGRSSINSVQIMGQAIGSEMNHQSYRIISTGALGNVTVGGRPFSSAGNMAVQTFNSSADPLQVKDLFVFEESRVYTAVIQFNQAVNPSTLAPALRISELRSGGSVSIALAQGTDYSVQYDAANQRALIRFAQEITDRGLPQVAGVPGPGVYRFVLDAAIIRGQTQNTLIDGNGDGFVAPGESFSQDAIVGDAGDKLIANRVQPSPGQFIDFYAPADLDLVLDNNYVSDGLPDTNKLFTIRGVLGDHPDQSVDFFRVGSDVDLYKITLRAGQILRLGEMQGNAQLSVRALLDANGNELHSTQALFHDFAIADFLSQFGRFQAGGRETASSVRLPSALPALDHISRADNFLIKQTGTYYIMVSTTDFPFGADEVAPDVTDANQVPNIGAVPGATGAYNFTLEVFDDGDTGFSGDNDSGDGVRIVDAPLPISFAGGDGVFGTQDDLGAVHIGGFTFFLDRGPDGLPNTADDVVRGSAPWGITSQRTAGPDGVFGTALDHRITWVGASIGKANPTGVPQEITPDLDVFHLNNREPIAPGTRIRVTLGLTDFGSNMGVTQEPRPGETRPNVQDLRGHFQFAIFETSTSTALGDALLLAAPGDALPVGAQATKTVTDGVQSYGYDANGDFFIEFIAAGRQGIAGVVPASYAIYVQGAVRTDYTVTVVTQGTGTVAPRHQNVVIETQGGFVDWLEAGGIRTHLAPFSTSVLGFSGLIGATPVDDYVLQRVLANVDSIFASANADVRISTTSHAFEGQPFSTVFLTRSNEPSSFAFNATFGVSQHVDYFNLDRSDQAVVFMPSLSLLVNDPSQVGVEALIQNLTAAVTRRIGELVGLRPTNPAAPGALVPVMASNSVLTVAPAYSFTNASLQLSNGFDTLYDSNFYLGRQNSFTLLDRILADRF